VCPGVSFTISATATNGSTYELWNAANSAKIADLPYITSVVSNTNYYVRAISGTTPACTTSVAYTVSVDNTKPVITVCPSNQNLNTNSGNCIATLPDYTTSTTATDNCTASGSIVKTQSPVAGTSLNGGHNSTQLVTITATDASGNFQTCTFTVTVKDTEVPVISGTAVSGNKNTDAGQCYYSVSGTEFDPTVTSDNCGIQKRTYKINAGAEVGTNASTSLSGVQLTKGTNVILWKAYDINGNTSTWTSFTITVLDDQNPVITNCPSNRDLNMNSSVCTAVLPDYISTLSITATDNCGSGAIVLSQSPVSGTNLNGGHNSTQLITITATDASGKFSTCTFTVTVKDTQSPAITCPTNIAQNIAEGTCGATVNYTAPVGIDNCPSAITVQTAGLASGATFPVGITTNTFEVTDGAGLKSNCSFTVTITDNEFPAISCPAAISVSATAGSCGAVVTYSAPVGTDNCAGETTLQTAGLASGSTFPLGITTNTFQVTDASGNVASCSFNVTVTDAEDPTIACPSDIAVNNTPASCLASVVIPEIIYGDNCTGSSIAWTASGATTLSGSGQPGTKTFNVGITTVTVTVTDAGLRSASCNFTVTVADNQKPVIAGCPANISRTSSAGVCTAVVSWTEPTASDNCTASGSLVWTKSHTPGSTFSAGTTTVTYTAKDAANNVSNVCSFDITVVDNQKPIISGCPANISTNPNPTTGCTSAVSWTEPTATDNCTAAGSLIWTKSKSPGDVFNSGTTTVTYTATDANGNISNACSFNVTVTDNVAPIATCKPATLYLNSSGVATLLVADVNNGSTDNCTAQGSLIITLSKTSFNCTNKGENTVTMTVKDAIGNTSACDATVTVADNTGPSITATSGTADGNVNVSSGVCYYTVNGSVFDPVVTDNCTGSILSYSVSGATTIASTPGSMAGVHLEKGTNVITWTATDASGNVGATPLSFTKTIVDNLPPVISAKTNQNRNTDNAICGYTAIGTEFDVTVTDNCSSYTLSYKLNSGTPVVASSLNGIVFPTGTTAVTWTASDGTNTSTRTFQVTVVDDDFPTISAQANIIANINTGCGAAVSWTTPTASDNCSGVALAQLLGPVSGSTFPIGTTAIQYRATDAAGHVTYLNFNVIVSDGTAPTVTCPSGSTELIPFERNAATNLCFYTVIGTEFNATATDGCPGNLLLTNSFDGSSSLTGKQIPAGTHTIVWTATDGINTSTCSIYVKINDIQNPTYTQPTGDHTKPTDPGKCYFTVPGTGFDLSNISDNCTTQIPTYVITKIGISPITGTNTLAGLQLPKDAANPYSIVWTLKDASNNTVTASAFTITVTDNQPPSFVCHGNESRTIPSNACKYLISGTEFDPTGLTDNCDAGSVTATYVLKNSLNVTIGSGTTLAGVELIGGEYTVIWNSTDLSSNTVTCTFKVTVADLVLPAISVITDQTRNAPSNACNYIGGTNAANEFDPTVTDNCPSVTLVHNQSSHSSNTTLDGFPFPVGITVVVWTATDASGNVTTKQFQVTVPDITPPAYTLPATASKNASSTSCYYTVVGNEFDPTGITDNCTSANYTIINNFNNYKSLEYAQFPVGITNVEWSVKDNYGNELKKTIVVTVTDNLKPVISCPGSSYTRVVDQGKSYYTVGTNEFKPVVTDNCAVVSYTNSYNSTSSLNGVQLNAGSYNIVWTATDAAGNQEFCTVSVEVVTDLYPSITCVGDQSKNNTGGICGYTVVGTEFNATSTTSGATLSNNFNSSSTLAGATFPFGTTLVTWTASKTVNSITYTNYCSYYVFVYDNELPVITPQANINTTTNSGCYATGINLGVPVRTDNCGVSDYWSNAPSSYPIGATTVTWWIRDIHNNSSTAIQTVTVVDDDAPIISCTSACRQADFGQTYYTVFDHELDPYTAWDCSGISSITNNFNSTSTLQGTQIPVGTHTIVWTITDNATPTKNTTTCESFITINSIDPPAVTCRGNASRATGTGVCTYTVQGTEFNVTSTATLTYLLTGATSGTGTSLTGVVLNKGVTTVRWTATSGSDVNDCCIFTVSVYDNQAPVVTWPDNITQNVDAGSCTATVSLGTPTSVDNCDGTAPLSYTRTPSGNNFSIGTTSVYWTAWDSNGLSVSHTQTVTVTDNILPVITCPVATYYRELNNSYVTYYTILGNEFTPPVSDNCTLSSYSNNLTGNGYLNGSQLTLGDHPIVWTATDTGGNQVQCTVNVTVVESFHPEISCPTNSSQYTASGACTYTVSGTGQDAVFTSATVIAGRTLAFALSGATTLAYDLANTSLNGVALNRGTTTVTWTAKQTIGGVEYSSTCSHTIVVTDNVPPVIDAFANVTVNVNPGTCTNTMTLTPPTATDNCTSPVTLITSNAPATFILGATNVRWTIADGNGNSTIYNQTVTVVDNEGPVITGCPGNKTAVASGGSCMAVVSWPPLIATDECSGVKTFTSNYAPGSLFPVGTTTVTYTAYDKALTNAGAGNVSTCSFDVVITDSNPTIACVANTPRSANSRTCSYLVLGNELDPTAFGDNCGIQSLTWSFIDKDLGTLRTGTNSLSGVTIPRGHGVGATGIVPITWRVTDLNNQFTECTFNLTIQDLEGPQIVVPGNATRNVDLHQKYYTVQGAEFDYVETFDNCGIVVKTVNTLNLSTFAGLKLNVGVNTITWYAEDDKGNSSSESFNITVIDNEPPVRLTEAAGTTATAVGSCVAQVNYTPPTFYDYGTESIPTNITISPSWAVTGATTFPVGITQVTYMVVDSNGNSLSSPFNVIVTDNVNPTITCPSGSPFTKIADSGKAYYTTVATEFNPSFSDNCAVSISNNYNNRNTLADATFPVGTTEVIWTARDASGNTSACTIQVIVTDDQKPVISNCPDATTIEPNDMGFCSFMVPGAEYDPFSFSDNQGLQKLTYQIGSGAEVGTNLTTTLADVIIPVGTSGAPTTTVTWRLYDLSGNISNTCSTVFTVNDIQSPTVITVPNQTRNTDAGQADYTAKIGDGWNPTITDNCAVQDITYKIDSQDAVGSGTLTSIVGQHFTVGTHNVVWTATDIHGNPPTSGSYQVIVTDNEPPVVVCKNITVDLDNTGNYTLTTVDIAAIAAGSTDENLPLELSVTPSVFGCSNVGDNTVILTVTDSNGNVSSCNTAIVTVRDLTPPVAICKAVTLSLDVLGNATVAATSINNGSTDACGIASYQISKDNTTFTNSLTYTCNEVAINNIYLKVTDVNGNSSVCSTTATVVDDILPSAVCKNITVALDATGHASITGNDIDFGSTDNCGLTYAAAPNTFDCTKIGANTVTLTVTDPGGHTDQCTSTVTIVDNIAPTAICKNITIQLDVAGNASIAAADINNDSNDACGILSLVASKTAFTCADIGANTVTLTVTDNHGNVSTCTSTVTVVDGIAPGVTCTTDKTVSTDADACTYTHSGTDWNATATDG
jgi:hypothetical protein